MSTWEIEIRKIMVLSQCGQKNFIVLYLNGKISGDSSTALYSQLPYSHSCTSNVEHKVGGLWPMPVWAKRKN
jgi:hypothetical protein